MASCLYVQGLSPDCPEYALMSDTIVSILCHGQQLVEYQPRDAEELFRRLRDEKFSTVYFRGHGDEDGNWILPNFQVAEMLNISEILAGKEYLVDLFSTCCYSHKWTRQTGNLRVIGSSSNYCPYEKGTGLISYFLSQLSVEAKLGFLREFYTEEEYGRFVNTERTSLQHLHADVFSAVENVICNMCELDISLVKRVPSRDQLKAIFDDFAKKGHAVVDPLSKEDTSPFPRGFTDWRHFVSFFELVNSIRCDSHIVFHGSSVTGYRHKAKGGGLWFDKDSDYDVALCNSALYEEIIEADPSMQKDGEHTGEITLERNHWFPEIHEELRKSYCRKVNFMVYKNLEAAKHHAGLSLVVEKDVDGYVWTYIVGEQLPFLKSLL
jgi:hypothetical protein